MTPDIDIYRSANLLAKIDENLIRDDLTALDRAEQLERRKWIFGQKGGVKSATLGGEQDIGFMSRSFPLPPMARHHQTKRKTFPLSLMTPIGAIKYEARFAFTPKLVHPLRNNQTAR